MRNKWIAIALLLAMLLPFGTALAMQAVDPTVRETAYGLVQGYRDDEKQAYVWKGIPYGKEPVGDLRWKSPVSPDPWDGVLETTAAGQTGLQFSGGAIIGSTDCLNLDIYRPLTDEENLPVVVFIHGGNNQTGTAAEIPGETLVNAANCVYVSLNYRLGALGFNCLPALKTGDPYEDSGNYTLLDIAAALDFIAENAASFGGDGTNITVTGFSAGGRDVMAMLVSPLFEGKFQKAIAYSGGMTIADTEQSVKVIAKALAPLVVVDGVMADEEAAYAWLQTEEEAVREYLYGLEAERLVSVMTNAGIRMSVFPHLFNDGVVLPKEGFATDAYLDVPLIMVTGTGEFSFFASGSPYYAADSADGTLYTDPEKLAGLLFATHHGGNLYELFNAEESAAFMAERYNAPIYTATIDLGGNAETFPSMAIFGAFHGVFVPLIDQYNVSYQPRFIDAYGSEGGQALGAAFRAYLHNFIRSGSPNGEDLIAWDAWTAEEGKPNTLLLTADTENALIAMADRRISYDAVLAAMDADTSISEEAKAAIIAGVLNGRWFSGQLDAYYGNESLWVK